VSTIALAVWQEECGEVASKEVYGVAEEMKGATTCTIALAVWQEECGEVASKEVNGAAEEMKGATTGL
jgi:hypothetical protein